VPRAGMSSTRALQASQIAKCQLSEGGCHFPQMLCLHEVIVGDPGAVVVEPRRDAQRLGGDGDLVDELAQHLLSGPDGADNHLSKAIEKGLRED